MDIIHAIILSIVEGVSEFLPISSTGHLNLTRVLLNLPKTEFFTTFEIFIQLGAILAVVFIYFKTISRNINIWKKILAGFLPAAVIGLLFGKFIKDYLVSNEIITLISLFLGGIVIILLELIYKEKEHHVEKIEDISYSNAIMIGLFQVIAVIPGVSRSASTIIGALFLGTKRKTAVEFSFLLAIPTMIAATAFDLKDVSFTLSSHELTLMLIGFIGSFITALIAVKFFLSYINKHTFIPFGIYRILLALIFWYYLIK